MERRKRTTTRRKRKTKNYEASIRERNVRENNFQRSVAAKITLHLPAFHASLPKDYRWRRKRMKRRKRRGQEKKESREEF